MDSLEILTQHYIYMSVLKYVVPKTVNGIRAFQAYAYFNLSTFH